MVTGSSSRLSGGLFFSVKALARKWSELEGVEVIVLAYADQFSDRDLESWAPLNVLHYRTLFTPIFAMNIFSLLSEFNPDVIYQNGVWTTATRTIRKYARANAGVKHIVAPRGMLDDWAISNGSKLKALLYKSMVFQPLREISSFHALNESEKRAIASRFPNNIIVSPNGVERVGGLSNRNGHSFREWLFIGRIHPKKGLRELIGALSLLHEDPDFELDVRLKIAGWVDDSDYDKQLRIMVHESGLDDCVEFVGEAYGNDKHKLLSQCSVFILPSFSEGLPMAILEAWKYAMITLITEECNLPTAFSKEAAFQIHTDVKTLSKELAEFMSTKSLRKELIAINGRQLMENEFNWDSIASKFLDEIRRLR